MKPTYNIDIHAHPTMRAAHTMPVNGETRNHWVENHNDVVDSAIGRWAWKESGGVAKVSQSNFYNCMKGNVRVVFNSLYPVERGFINFRKVPKILIGKRHLRLLLLPVQEFRKNNTTSIFNKIIILMT